MKHWFFLRGLVRESGHWNGLLEEFEAKIPGVKTFALDLPGSGIHYQAECPASVPEMVETIRKDFLQNMGEENYVFALSLGAMAAFSWMEKYPQDFAGGVFVNTSLKGLSPFHQRLSPRNYAKILSIVCSGNISARERGILEMTSHSKEKFPQIVEDWTRIQNQRPVSKKNAIRQLLAAARFSPPQKKPPGKLLLLNGARDELVSPLCSEAIARHWNIPLLVHPEAGHDLTLDARDWAIEKVKENFS
jgi:pimeloyl-ACP methyl ester carboxylesterase